MIYLKTCRPWICPKFFWHMNNFINDYSGVKSRKNKDCLNFYIRDIKNFYVQLFCDNLSKKWYVFECVKSFSTHERFKKLFWFNTLSAKDELSRPSFYTSYAKDEIYLLFTKVIFNPYLPRLFFSVDYLRGVLGGP